MKLLRLAVQCLALILLPWQVAVAAELTEIPSDPKGNVLLYGAYGYTGKGIANLAAEYGITPVLSGRNGEKLKAFADEVGYDYITLSLDDNHERIVEVLRGIMTLGIRTRRKQQLRTCR